jgi:hypothetical protein
MSSNKSVNVSECLGELPNQSLHDAGANSFRSWPCRKGMPIFCTLARSPEESKETMAARRRSRHDDSIPILDMYCSGNSFPVAPLSRDCGVVSGAALKVLHLPDRGRPIFAD